MDSPICHNEKKDGLKAFYYPDLKELVFNTLQLFDCPENSVIEDYNNYNTILLGIMIERVTGTRIAGYFGKHIWSKIGTESKASWSTDKKGQTMMSAGINARAVDFAKLGKLVLDDGKWKNKVLIRKEWLQESIHRHSYHWYKSYLGYNRALRKSDFYALGIRGQILYVSPNLNTIILRFGSSRLGIKKPKNVDSRWENINSEFAGMNWVARIKEIAKELHASREYVDTSN